MSLVFPQSPQGINYQAVVRDADGILYENQTLTVAIFLIFIFLESNPKIRTEIRKKPFKVSLKQFPMMTLSQLH